MKYQKLLLTIFLFALFSLTACGAPRPPKMNATGWKPVNVSSPVSPIVLEDPLHPGVPLHNPNK